jgi:hypothetical protein
MKTHFTLWFLISILSSQSFPQYARNSSALNNIGLVNNPNIETSVDFKSYGSSDEIPWVGEIGITETVSDIMEREKNNPTIFNGCITMAAFRYPILSTN